MAQEYKGTFARHDRATAPVTRIIVGLRPEAGAARIQAAGPARIQSVFQRTGLKFRAERELNASMRVVDLEAPVTGTALADALARIASDPDVAFAEPDARVYRHALPVDPLYAGQWYLQGQQVAASNAESAWDVTTGSTGVVVAVLDTGVRFDHPDLLQAGRGGRLLPGHDFVGPDPGGGGFRMANDGDGWDSNPADPGDWVTSSEASSSLFSGCASSPSSWHGTRVAGLVGAIANNGTGIAGGTWDAWILPVRVLGKCFGNNSDILQGMRWAAGLHVAGVPDNPYPARILNMSLGATGSCTAGYQNVLAELAATGVLVTASAGNEDGPVDYPANCAGVAGVTGLRHIGTKVGYSSFGPEVTISAPGGNCVNVGAGQPCLFSLDTTSNLGTKEAQTSSYTDQFDFNVGTSFSAPQVAAVAALMVAINGNLRGPQLIARLREAASPFPPEPMGLPACQVGVSSSDLGCACTMDTCGAGIANAPASLAAAERPIAAIEPPPSVMPAQNVDLDGSASAAACTRTVAGYSWSVVSGNATINNAGTAIASVTAPSNGSPSFTLRLTVTDDHGAQDTADVTITSQAATTAAPADAGSSACPAAIVPADPGPFVDDGPPTTSGGGGGGGGGGGSLGLAGLLVLVAGAAAAATRRPRA